MYLLYLSFLVIIMRSINNTIQYNDFKYGFYTNINIAVNATRGGNMLLEVMCKC